MKRQPVLLAMACAAALALAPAPALAATPLPAPTDVEAVHVADTSADLWWLRNGASAQDVVERLVNGVWREHARGLYGDLALTGLTPATTYTFRVYSIPVDGLGYTTSARSGPVSFTTLAGPDTVAPAKPPTPIFSGVTTTMATVHWGESTDNVQVTGYHLQQLIGGVWTTIRTVSPAQRSQTITGLAPGTAHSFAAIAFDARGNLSVRADPGTVTTLATTTVATCRAQVVTYGLGFQVTVTIINTTTAPLTGWAVRFTLPAGAGTGSAFGGVLTRSGSTGTITAAPWSTTIGPGGQLFVGFSGSSPAAPATPPTGFTINHQPCATV